MSESRGAVLAMINARYLRGNDIPEWSWNENKTFENAIAAAAAAVDADNSFSDIVGEISSRFSGKTKQQIQMHLDALIEDIRTIEHGLIPLPDYGDSGSTIRQNSGDRWRTTAAAIKHKHHRKKAVPWTKEEHEQFLIGLEKYGKGDWRSISRQCVMTKTPIQIASHAQKYFLRLKRNSATRTSQIRSNSNLN
ncbi:PREDICTED: transcription factor DIVARICATA-like [Tarenaya hassleriana]|uniref:transcription factor DIVARICATA-like n=1 Tax=Tarenaya hassleriana TaxID=28532 RepID=UPI00053C1DBE|nr:PREDICTED: transcription factor DIVARICATA-like [Tarenaya hassleriana]